MKQNKLSTCKIYANENFNWIRGGGNLGFGCTVNGIGITKIKTSYEAI